MYCVVKLGEMTSNATVAYLFNLEWTNFYLS